MASCESVAAGSTRACRVRELGTKADEPGVERKAALGVADAELGRTGLAGDHDRQVDQVERVAAGDNLSCGEAHGQQGVWDHGDLLDQLGLEVLHDGAVGRQNAAHDLRLDTACRRWPARCRR